jgi:ABC-2 type transport system permease protein
MLNLWLVAKHEFRKKAGNRKFILTTLGFPLALILIMGVTIAITIGFSQDDRPVGYVDQAGILNASVLKMEGEQGSSIQMVPFQDAASAKAALTKKELQAVFIIPSDYLTTRGVTLYYAGKAPDASIRAQFNRFILASLTSKIPENIRARLIDAPKLTVRSMDGSKELNQGRILEIILPFAAGFILAFSVMISAGTLLQVVADEKENRTIEILITTLSPEQIIGGKIVGLLAVSLTQLTIWGIALAGCIFIGSRFFEALQQFQIPWTFLLIIGLFFIPTFTLIAGVMTSIGGSVAETSQGQQIAGLINMLFMLPFFFSALMVIRPDSPLVVALTIFPTTAFTTIALRWGFSVIPAWQLILSWILLAACALLSIWASSRIFRLGMLRYGKSLDFRTALSSLWSKI